MRGALAARDAWPSHCDAAGRDGGGVDQDCTQLLASYGTKKVAVIRLPIGARRNVNAYGHGQLLQPPVAPILAVVEC